MKHSGQRKKSNEEELIKPFKNPRLGPKKPQNGHSKKADHKKEANDDIDESKPFKRPCLCRKKPKMRVIMPREKFHFLVVDWDSLEETFIHMDSVYENHLYDD
ncbi:hypothetical protein ACH5RR_026426 [Cinchona calisaya]|uniref:Uncharacterized protein n=1 Tax=Cinchona calisaya TaxID=153742 RepID=A0ABD2Z3N0_9GENT